MNPLIWEQDRWNIAGGETRSSHDSGSLLRSCNSKTIVHARLQLKLQASICGFNNFFWWRFGSTCFEDYRFRPRKQRWSDNKNMNSSILRKLRKLRSSHLSSRYSRPDRTRRPLQCIKNVYCNDFIEFFRAAPKFIRLLRDELDFV